MDSISDIVSFTIAYAYIKVIGYGVLLVEFDGDKIAFSCGNKIGNRITT